MSEQQRDISIIIRNIYHTYIYYTYINVYIICILISQTEMTEIQKNIF